jgi:SSS family solute:Na+ symporter
MNEFLPPFMLGVVFMGAIAAIHSTAAPYIGTGGSILLRDVYWRYIRNQEASHAEQIWMNRVFATVLTIAGLDGGHDVQGGPGYSRGAGNRLRLRHVRPAGGRHLGISFPAASVPPRCSHRHGHGVSDLLCLEYPLSMHCAFWGTFSGLVVAYICRGLGIKDDEETIKRQAEVRAFLDDIDEPSESGKQWRSVMKIAVPIWYFFAIGPACILGNKAFSFPGLRRCGPGRSPGGSWVSS